MLFFFHSSWQVFSVNEVSLVYYEFLKAWNSGFFSRWDESLSRLVVFLDVIFQISGLIWIIRMFLISEVSDRLYLVWFASTFNYVEALSVFFVKLCLLTKWMFFFVTSCLRFSAGHPYTAGFSFNGVYMYTTCFWTLGSLPFDIQLTAAFFVLFFMGRSNDSRLMRFPVFYMIF